MFTTKPTDWNVVGMFMPAYLQRCEVCSDIQKGVPINLRSAIWLGYRGGWGGVDKEELSEGLIKYWRNKEI